MEHVRFLIWGCLFSLGNLFSLAAQENAPNDISIPWYSQKVLDTSHSHNPLVASLMVIDYYKGMTADSQAGHQKVEKKIEEYQNNYFLTKGFPFRERKACDDGDHTVFEIDSLVRYYEGMKGVDYREDGDYNNLFYYINEGLPVLVNILYDESGEKLIAGNRRHWLVIRGITDKYIWLNDPGYAEEERLKGENRRFLIGKEREEEASFDDCWSGKYMVILPAHWKGHEGKDRGRIPYIEIQSLPKGHTPHSTPKDIKATF